MKKERLTREAFEQWFEGFKEEMKEEDTFYKWDDVKSPYED